MTRWRPVLLVAAVTAAGGAGTLVVGALAGMGAGEIGHLALVILPAAIATLVAVAMARPLLARSSIRVATVVVAVVGALVGLANLFVLSRLMFVSRHDATLVGVLFLYALGSGVGSALVLAHTSAGALRRVAATARSLGRGDQDARVGRLGASPELEGVAAALDEMADRLQRAMARVREVEGRRRDLITAVSHDLRTPLAGLRATVEAIDEGVVADLPTLRRYAAEMRRSVDTLVTLTDDLFELAQLDAGAIERETERARLEEIVHSALAACRSEADGKGLVVRTELDGAADATCSPRLVRVLQNLLQNAIRHTPADGTVLIEALRVPGELQVAVEDTGEGIPREALERVFDPFYRADPSRHGGGAGLGLTLARRIVEAMGGRIEARSEPAGGSRFSVRLPEPSLR
jgi:signal transduction histidine kinase